MLSSFRKKTLIAPSIIFGKIKMIPSSPNKKRLTNGDHIT